MNKENTQVGFALQGIKTEQFAIIEENYDAKKEINLGTSFEFKIDWESKRTGIFLQIEFSHGNNVFIKLLISCHFKIQEKSWNMFLQPNEPAKITIPKNFLTHLAMITTGTARGILFTKTEGTPFAKFIVPTINVTEMITQDASFEAKID